MKLYTINIEIYFIGKMTKIIMNNSFENIFDF